MKKPALPRLRGWEDLLEHAHSDDATSRAGALGVGYVWIKHALNAAGIPRSRDSKEQNVAYRVLTCSSDLARAGIDIDQVRQAIQVRRLCGEEGEIPDPDECAEAASTLQEIWQTLRTRFVNMSSAIDLAKAICERAGVRTVGLYGSLSRKESSVHDIDLLILDNGDYSDHIEFGTYDDGTFDVATQTVNSLRALGIDNRRYKLCAKCRWLDVKVIDGTRFGVDWRYTHLLERAQPDPWFFINVAKDIRTFDGEAFTEDRPFPFSELAPVHDLLKRYGLGLSDAECDKMEGDVEESADDYLADVEDEDDDTEG